MHRFFVSPDCMDGTLVRLPEPVTSQLRRVLRARPGDEVLVLDDSGWEYLVRLDVTSAARAEGTILSKRESRGEPSTKVTLYQAVLKSDRFEHVLQKGVEVGVSAFVPTTCSRSVPRIRDEGFSGARYARWRKIIAEAAEQSGRGRLPSLFPPMTFPDACEAAGGCALLPWEGEQETSLKSVLRSWRNEGVDASSVAVFIGPEGGLEAEEVRQARSKGVVPVGLGARTLRSETAGIVTAAALMYELGELGG